MQIIGFPKLYFKVKKVNPHKIILKPIGNPGTTE